MGGHSYQSRGWAGRPGLVSLSGYNQAGSVSLGETEKWNQSLVLEHPARVWEPGWDDAVRNRKERGS